MMIHTNIVMKKANKIRGEFGGDYRAAMNKAIRAAYEEARQLEERIGEEAEYEKMVETYLDNNGVDAQEIGYYMEKGTPITANYLREFLPAA